MKGIRRFFKRSAAVLVAVLALTQGVWTADAAPASETGRAAGDSAVTAKANDAGGAKEKPPAPYTVTFDARGGTVTPTKGATGDAGTLASLPVPLRNEYSFSGWFTDTTGGRQVTAQTAFSANTAVYARWALITYTVTFDTNGGDGAVEAGKTGKGGTLASLPAPNRAGYTFAGWYTSQTGGSQITAATVFGANATVYARWTLITHTVTFDVRGGTVTPTTGAANENGTLASLPTPARNNYTFQGWFTSPAGGDSVTTGRVYSGNATIYARWTPVKYTVAFNAGGGTVSQNSATTGDAWKLSSLPAPTKSGYAFRGWFTAAAGGDSVTVNRTYNANAIIYAQWTLVKYTVTFNANGGKVTPAFAATGDGWTLASLPVPVRTGYSFDGWYTAATDGSSVTANTVFTANATVYARWKLILYTITFNANGGKASAASGTTADGWKLASLPVPSRTGYTFDGWHTAAAGGSPVTAARAYTENTAVYAHWKLVSYTVTFDVNITGGKVSPASGVTGNGWKLASLPTPTKDGYAFLGWFTAAAGGDSVTTNTAFTSNTAIYAKWKLSTSLIKFNTNGGTVTPASVTTGDGWKVASLPTPAREGYAFAGWFTDSAGGAAVKPDMAFHANTSVHARWTLITYRITFEPNITGGKVSVASGTTGAGWALGSLPVPVREGYAFDGWYTASSGGTAVTGSTAFGANAVIYARWTAAYTITFSANGGDVAPASAMTGPERKLASLPTPTRAGYAFDGWYTALNGGTKVTAQTVFNGNATVYARWVVA